MTLKKDLKREGSRESRLRDDNLVEIIAYEENANGVTFDKRQLKIRLS